MSSIWPKMELYTLDLWLCVSVLAGRRADTCSPETFFLLLEVWSQYPKNYNICVALHQNILNKICSSVSCHVLKGTWPSKGNCKPHSIISLFPRILWHSISCFHGVTRVYQLFYRRLGWSQIGHLTPKNLTFQKTRDPNRLNLEFPPLKPWMREL